MKQKIIILLLTFILFFPFIINAKELKNDWIVSLGGDGTDEVTDLKLLDDGSYITIGYSYSSSFFGVPNTDGALYFIIKYDNNGSIEWHKIFSYSDYSFFKMIDFIPGKGYLVLATTRINENSGGEFILFDFDGNIVWNTKYDKNGDELFRNLLVTDDSFFVLGTTKSTNIENFENKGECDTLILKYDFNGNLLWERTYGTEYFDEPSILRFNNNDELIIPVVSTNAEGNDIYGSDLTILKYDRDGNLLNKKVIFNLDSKMTIYGEPFYSDGSFTLLLRSDASKIGDYINNDNISKTYAVKFDVNLNLLFVKELFNFSIQDYLLNENEDIYLLSYLNNANYINEFGLQHNGGYDTILVKYNKDFELVFKKIYGGSGNDKFYLMNFFNDEIVVIGDTTSKDFGIPINGPMDGVIAFLDMDGDVVNKISYGGNSNDGIYSSVINKNSILIYGLTASTDLPGITFNGGKQDIVFSKYSLYYDLKLDNENIDLKYGNVDLYQKEDKGIIVPKPDDGYEVDKVIVKDKEGNALDIEVTQQEDGTFIFPLYTDVSVEVLFKEKLVNPKTGLIDYALILLSIFASSVMLYFIITKYESKTDINLGM